MSARRARRRLCWLAGVTLACLLTLGMGAPPLHLPLILRQHGSAATLTATATLTPTRTATATPTATLTPTRTPTRAG